MLGRWIFGLVLALVGVMYLWLAWMATFGNPNSTDLAGNILGAVLFLAIGAAAAVAAMSLLRQKRR
jgi:drug/metabolite transporter (DMT)-like permease